MAKKETRAAPRAAAKKESGRIVHTFRQVILASVGAVGVAQDEVNALIKRMVERGELTEKDARKLVNDVQKEVNKRRRGGQTKAERELEGMMEKLNVPSKADIEDLTSQVSALAKRIDDLKAEMNKK